MKKNIVLFLIMILFIATPMVMATNHESQENVKITVAARTVGQFKNLAQQAAQRYMDENPNVTVEIIETPEEAQDVTSLYLQFFESKSSELDVYIVGCTWVGDMEEHFVDLNKYGAEEVINDHFSSIINDTIVNGRLVTIPVWTDAGLLYYRKDLLNEYGYSNPPKTWNELEEMSKTIQKGERVKGNNDFWGYVWQGNSYEGLSCNALEWLASNNAGTIISPEGKITVNNENAVEMINKAASWVGEISPPGIVTFTEEEARNMFQIGNAAFMRNWPYAYSLAKSEDSPIRGKFEVAPLPAGKAGKGFGTLGGWNFGVSKYSKNPDIAADVALYMASYKEQKIRAIEGSINPTIGSLYKDPEVLEASPFFEQLFDVLTDTVALPSTVSSPNYNEVSSVFYTNVHSVLTGELDAKTALDYAEYEIKDITGFEIGDPKLVD